MDLEKEISGKFENDYHKAVVNIIYTYGWLTTILRKELSRHQLTLQQFNILRILRGQHPKPATVNLLKERMLDKMSDASRIVDRLVQKGMVSRCTNQKDRRAVDIIITTSGLEVLKKIDSGMMAVDMLEDNLELAEVKQLNILLDKLRGK